jgi:hypothetical protein
MNKLEKEFEELYNSTFKRIEEELAKARTALRKAVDISEETGVPFSSDICFLSNEYTPKTFISNWEELDHEFVYDLTEVYDLDYCGWTHSAAC